MKSKILKEFSYKVKLGSKNIKIFHKGNLEPTSARVEEFLIVRSKELGVVISDVSIIFDEDGFSRILIKIK